MKWTLAFCALLLLFFPHEGHFDPKNLYSECGKGSEETSSIAHFLNQRFFYLGEGSQMYAFRSEDGTCVLKLFKARHQKPFKLTRFIHHLQRTEKDWEKSSKKWRLKFQQTCRRYKMAFIDLKEETGLLYVHFQKSFTPLPVTLVDRYSHTLDLSQYPFILQKRAILAPDYFRRNLGKTQEAKQALKDLFAKRLQKGYSDSRQSLSSNYGFIEGRAIQIDSGKIEPFTGDKEAELKKIYAHIEEWASKL